MKKEYSNVIERKLMILKRYSLYIFIEKKTNSKFIYLE